MSALNHCPIEVRGKVYPSVKSAAKALGIQPASVSSYLTRRGHTRGLGLGFKSPHRNQTARNAKPVTIHGHRFDSIKAAATALGLSYQALHRTLTKPMTPKKSDRLLRIIMQWQAREAEKKARAQ